MEDINDTEIIDQVPDNSQLTKKPTPPIPSKKNNIRRLIFIFIIIPIAICVVFIAVMSLPLFTLLIIFKDFTLGITMVIIITWSIFLYINIKKNTKGIKLSKISKIILITPFILLLFLFIFSLVY